MEAAIPIGIGVALLAVFWAVSAVWTKYSEKKRMRVAIEKVLRDNPQYVQAVLDFEMYAYKVRKNLGLPAITFTFD